MDPADELRRYSKQKRYFVPPLNIRVTIKYLRFKIIRSPFDSEKTDVAEYLVVNEGVTQIWARPNKHLASTMAEIPFGSTISILRTGLKKETKYDIQIIES